MDVLEGPYYRINRILLTCLGQWPYQRTLYKSFCRLGYACVLVSILVPEILRLIDVWGQLDYVIDCASILGIHVANSIKISNYFFNGDKMKKLLTRMENNWRSDTFQPEMKILKNYAREGRRLTQIYGVCMYSTLVTFVLLPLMPKLLDTVMPLNESRPAIYLIPVKYGNINHDKYYIPMMLHADLAALFAITTIVGNDTTYTVYVQHACGIFAALGDRLQRLIKKNPREFMDKSKADKIEEDTYRAIVECVKMHREAIDFANAIESIYTVVFFFVIGVSIFLMSSAGYQMVMNLDKPNEAVRFAVFTLAQVAHMFYINWPGQKLMDHSERMYEWVYGAEWYEVSPRSQKLLIIMMMRSVEPCRLTAGKLYDMSLANFSLVIRTSVSYFTVLTSFR